MVIFSNKVDLAPVELQLWPWEGRTYLLLKEHNFAKPRERHVNGFAVASLAKAEISGKDRTIHPTLVCRFTLQ